MYVSIRDLWNRNVSISKCSKSKGMWLPKLTYITTSIFIPHSNGQIFLSINLKHLSIQDRVKVNLIPYGNHYLTVNVNLTSKDFQSLLNSNTLPLLLWHYIKKALNLTPLYFTYYHLSIKTVCRHMIHMVIDQEYQCFRSVRLLRADLGSNLFFYLVPD